MTNTIKITFHPTVMKLIKATAKDHNMTPEDFCQKAVNNLLCAIYPDTSTGKDNKNDSRSWSNRA
jgi:hypothetical protein